MVPVPSVELLYGKLVAVGIPRRNSANLPLIMRDSVTFFTGLRSVPAPSRDEMVLIRSKPKEKALREQGPQRERNRRRRQEKLERLRQEERRRLLQEQQ